MSGSFPDPTAWIYEVEKDKLPIVYDNIMHLLSCVQNELVRRQNRSDAVSCPSFLPVVQSLVTPSKDPRRSSQVRSHSKQKKSASVSTQRSSINGQFLEDSGMTLGNPLALDTKIESVSQPSSFPSKSLSSEYSVSVKSEPPSAKQEEFVSQVHELKGPSRNREQSQLDPATPFLSSPSSESEVSTLPPSFDSYVEVPPPPVYRQAIEVMVTVASMGYHTERQLIQCCEDYLLQAPIPKESITQMRLLLPQLCHVLRYLDILVPCDSSTPLSPFIYHYPSIPKSIHTYPSFLCRNSSTKEEEDEAQVFSSFGTADHEEWPMGIPGEAISLAREGIVGDADWMGEKAKSVLYKWIGARSADWVRKTDQTPTASANSLVEAMNMPAYASVLSTSDSAISFNNETEVLPESITKLLHDPSLSTEILDQLDPKLQNILYAYIFNRSSYWRPAPAVPTSSSSVLGDASVLRQAREVGSVRLTVNREQLKEVMSGSLWKNQIHAEKVHNELEALKKRELELWRQICARYGVDLDKGNMLKRPLTSQDRLKRTENGLESRTSQRHEPVKRSGKTRERSEDRRRLRMSRPLDSGDEGLHLLSQPIQWMEVVENFTPVRKSKPLSPTPSLPTSPSVSVAEPETKHVTIPTVRTVSRKRPHATREEREKRKEDPVKRKKMEEETEYYLKMNSDNLQEMKDHLEEVRLKQKELKEKKKQKEKTKKKL